MNKYKLLGILAVFLIGILAMGIATALPTVEELEINGDVVFDVDDTDNTPTTLEVNLADDIEIKVRLNGDSANSEDVNIRAEIFGYEHDDLTDYLGPFDLDAGDTTSKKLSIALPNRMDKDQIYDLRIRVGDREGPSFEERYQLHLIGNRHDVLIRDVVLSPEYEVKAGNTLFANLRLENIGDRDEEGLKVSFTIPALGVTDSVYLDELEDDEQTTSKDLIIRVPKCSEAGRYKAVATVAFNDLEDIASFETTVNIVEDETCNVPTVETRATVSGNNLEIAKGGQGAVYTVEITNGAPQAKTFTVNVDSSVNEWADVKVQDRVVTIDGGDSANVFIYVTAKESANEGRKTFAVTTKSGGNTISELALMANVVADDEPAGEATSSTLTKSLQIGLIVLVVLLVILGLIIGFNKLKDNEPKEEEVGQTYY
ncbi:hypothetical protein ACFL1H_05130 [Nanoarchaeota archaeon]